MKRAIVGILLTACLSGCSSGKRIAKANDALRLERETLKERVSAVEAENAELKAKVSELNQRQEHPLSEEVLSSLPRIASIEIDSLSGIWAKYAGHVAHIVIVPRDGRGRFVQAVGSVEIRVVELGKDNTTPRVLATRTVMPSELRDSFVASLTGLGYSINMDIDEEISSTVVFEVILHDELTGENHEDSLIASSRPYGN